MFKKKHRYEKINWFIIQKSNLYNLNWVNQVKNKSYDKNNSKFLGISLDLFFINNKEIWKIKEKNININFLTKSQKITKIKRWEYFKFFKSFKENNKNIKKENILENIKLKIKQLKIEKFNFLKNSEYFNINCY